MLLAKKWTGSDPTGWIVSEKLDGWRCVWNYNKFLSRSGKIIDAPVWFTENFPNEKLDGEIWAGRGNFEKVASATMGSRGLDWKAVVYVVFDAPDFPGGFEKRIEYARQIVKPESRAVVITTWKCTGKKQLLDKLDEVVAGGGEGLMLRKSGSKYENKRSDTLLKVKKWTDSEAVVIAHVEGTRPGLCGSLQVMTKDGKVFKIASGLTEEMAHNPPPIGTVITYKYELLTKDGIPRPATFLRIRKDV